MRDILFTVPGAPVEVESKSIRRMHFDLGGIGLGEVPLLEVYDVRRGTEPVREHRHEGLLEISYLASGWQNWYIAGQFCPMCGNDVLVKHPGEPHGTGDQALGKGRRYILRLRLPARGRPFLTLDAREARPLVDALRALPHRHFLGDVRLRSLFEQIVLLLLSPERSPFTKLHAALMLKEWLLIVVACGQAAKPSRFTPDIQKVSDYAHAFPAENTTMRKMAQMAGLSQEWFKVKFKRQTGMGPMEHLMRAKVEAAKKLFVEHPALGVTEIAYRLGFSSSQYFATVFKRFTDKSPRDFRGE